MNKMVNYFIVLIIFANQAFGGSLQKMEGEKDKEKEMAELFELFEFIARQCRDKLCEESLGVCTKECSVEEIARIIKNKKDEKIKNKRQKELKKRKKLEQRERVKATEEKWKEHQRKRFTAVLELLKDDNFI